MITETQPYLFRRTFATILDFFLFWFLMVPFFCFFGEETPNGMTLSGLPALLPLISGYLYFVVLESALGFTPAKFLFGLRVVDSNANKLTLCSATKRRMLDFVDLWVAFGLVAIIVIKLTKTHQRCGDLWAKSFVVTMTETKREKKHNKPIEGD